MPYLLFVSICLIWGSSFVLMLWAGACLSPSAVGLARMLFGAAVLLVIRLVSPRPGAPTRRDWPPLLCVIMLGFTIPFAIQPYVIQRTERSAMMSLVVGLNPLFTILVAIPLLRTIPNRRQLTGVCGAFVLLAILFADGLRQRIALFDLLLATSVPLCYATANTLIRRSLAHLPAVNLTFLCLTVGAIPLSPFVLADPWAKSAAPELWTGSWVSAALLGVLGTGLATSMFNHLVVTKGPLFASMVTNVVPLIAVILGWSIGEPVSVTQLACMIGIVAMVVLVQYPSRPAAPTVVDELPAPNTTPPQTYIVPE